MTGAAQEKFYIFKRQELAPAKIVIVRLQKMSSFNYR